MSDKTGIGWTDATWNVVTGCSRVSDGCRHCYAEALSLRFGWSTLPWTAANAAFNIRFHPKRLHYPLQWKAPRRIFVNSMSDLFHDQVPNQLILAMFTVMRAATQHTFQILTKRPERMRDFMQHLAWRTTTEEERAQGKSGWQAYLDSPGSSPLPNVIVRVSVEHQREADQRIPLLLATPAAAKMISCEPLLSPVDLHTYLREFTAGTIGGHRLIDWVIVGGESGNYFRPMELDWARTIRDQCREASVPFFYKQGAGLHPGLNATLDGVAWQQYPSLNVKSKAYTELGE